MAGVALAFMRILALLWCASFINTQSVVDYNITENENPVVIIGNLIADSELRNLNQSQLNGKAFTIVSLDNNNHQYFDIDNNEGDLLLVSPIDRDTICPMMADCNIKLDIQVKTNSGFYLIKTSIIVLDVNDEEPQFRQSTFSFTLSEASAIGMTLNLPTATDIDSPQNGIEEYRVEDLDNTYFRFDLLPDEQEPIIVLTESLDREEKDSYEFILQAIDSATIPHTGSTQILIEVLDINDNSPEFEQSSYDVSVDENVESGYEIIRLLATDLDIGENARVLYQMNDRTIEQYGDLFQIGEDSGIVTLNGELDYEETQEVTLIVIAKNRDASSLFSQTRVNIFIQDINDNAPTIRINGDVGPEVAISEHTQKETFVVHVTVSDDDTQQGGIFSCSLDSPNFQLFQILEGDFVIETVTTFDRELQARYTLTFICTDQGSPPLSAEENINIIITDENDNRPEFEKDLYTLNVTENKAIGHALLTVTATDLDAEENGTIEYTLLDTTSFVSMYVKIDPVTGIITARRLLDYEEVTLLSFRVIASDKGNPPLSNMCNVTIRITDEDDNPPLFTLSSYTLEVKENNDIGAEIGRITASDADSFEFNAITYELAAIDDKQSDFSIDSFTGSIFANFTLNREQEANHSFIILAMGPPPAVHNASTIVNIKVADVNDERPVFLFPSDDNNTVSVPSYLHKDSIIAHIVAQDGDEGINAFLTYHIESGDVDGIFDLDPRTGYLTVNKDYTVTQVHSSEILILVSDGGIPQLTARKSLIIEFNQTEVESNSFSLKSRGKNESIAIVIGVLSGVVVVALLIAILCLIRRKNSLHSTKATRLQSLSESVDGNTSFQYGGPKYVGGVQGYVNDGLDSEDNSPVVARPSYMGENFGAVTGPVKDSGSESSNADSGHGSHEETSSLPGAGSLQKWDTVFLNQDPARVNGMHEQEIIEEENDFDEPGDIPQTFNPQNHMMHPDDDFSHAGSHSPPWLPLEEYHTSEVPLDEYHTHQATPYFLDQNTNYAHGNDAYQDSPDLYRDFVASSPRIRRGNVIDLRDYERDHNECFVDEELDTFDERYCESPIGRMPNHLKRRSNSFANDNYPYRDVFPDHVAGFCTPQPKNIKYCSQV